MDLAGSERNYETHAMTAAEHRESAAINKALFALKDCFRAAAKARTAPLSSSRIPFRSSSLTRVLRDCFVNPSHKTAIIAAVSPASSDMIHSLNTLDHVTMMAPHLCVEAGKGEGPKGRRVTQACALSDAAHAVVLDVPMRRSRRGAASDDDELEWQGTPVEEWTPGQVRSWIANAHNGRFAQMVLPPNTDGRKLLQLSVRELSNLVEEDRRVARGDGQVAWSITSAAKISRALFAALRDEQQHLSGYRGTADY